MRVRSVRAVVLVAVLQLFTTPSNVRADAAIPSKQAAWLTGVSVGIKESYDDNVFLGGADKPFLPAKYTVPGGSVAALKNVDSFVTTLSPRLGVNVAPLLGDQTMLQVLSLVYSPDFVTYHDASSESYNAQRLAATISGSRDAFSFKLENGFTYIDGSEFGPTYPGAFNSALATSAVRERRDQIQDRSTVVLRYDQDSWFVRPTGSLLDYDLRTTQLAGITGYQNYVDRYDVNGGADLGYKLDHDLAVTLGYRIGAQYQETFSTAIDPFGQTSSSDYQRLLMGVEGKLTSWLDVKVQAGPDFRSYTDAAPVNNHNPTRYYGEGALIATPTKNDTLSLNYRQWQWVSSTGKVPYFDSLYDLTYRRKLSETWSGNLGAGVRTFDYTSGESLSGTATKPVASTNLRNDWLYTLTAGLRYVFSDNVSADLCYSIDLARNAQLGLPDAQRPESKREFDRQIVSLGVQYKL